MRQKGTRPVIKLPRAVYITICELPAVLTILYYALRSVPGVMDWAAVSVSAPVRGALGLFSSIYPFSLMEVFCTAAGFWLIYYIVRSIIVTTRRREKLKILSKRLLTVMVVILYVWSLFCWLWNSGYHAPGFAGKNGFAGDGVTLEALTGVTRLFAEKSNELALMVKRNDDGRYIEDRREMLNASTEIFQNIADRFPGLSGRLYRPKTMMFSWLMSRTGYTGIYFALTGESNINSQEPGFMMPATVAHELAHQRGVFAEDEANFVGIAACVTSGNPVYEYAGYLRGLMYLMSALHGADYETWIEISGSLRFEVISDWQENSDFWESQRRVETGVEFLDNILTTVTVTVSDAVDTVYDGYLKSQNQELGIKSYGACVNLLVEYFAMH